MTTVWALRWTDALWCWRLARDPDVRRWSVDPKPPTPWGHLRWMWRWTQPGRRRAVVFRVRGERAGLLRWEGRRLWATVSVAVVKHHRQRGLAAEMLRWAAQAFPWTTFEARVHVRNRASRRLFERAGYTEREREGPRVVYVQLGRAVGTCRT